MDAMFHAALKAAIESEGFGAQKRLAEAVGVSSTRINQLYKTEGGSEPLRRKIARYYGCDYEEFLERGRAILAAQGEMIDGPTKAWTPASVCPTIILASDVQSTPQMAMENYYAAPLVEGKIAAGSGMTLFEDEIQSLVWIYAPALKDRREHNLIAVEISDKDGDSMSPTLEPGDIVLVDRDDPGGDAAAFVPGAIYAIRDGSGGCSVKRLYADGNGLIVSSDNRQYPPRLAWSSELPKLVIGRVVWGWRNLLLV